MLNEYSLLPTYLIIEAATPVSSLTSRIAVSLYLSLIHIWVQIQPDFDNAVFQGKVSLRGRIRLAAMFFYGLQIITDANVRGLIRRVRNR